MKFKDLTGQKFGRLTVIERIMPNSSSNKTRWLCKCGCGESVVVIGANLINQTTKSCGCLAREVRGENLRNIPREIRIKNSSTHGYRYKKEYNVWSRMKQRCINPKNKDYKYYGGRGIKYDPRWERFENFLTDMGDCPDNKNSIDRIDCNGSYSKENCRWADVVEQARNHRVQANNSTGIRGVSKQNKGYQVTINSKYVGYATTLEEAKHIRIQAEIKEFGKQITA